MRFTRNSVCTADPLFIFGAVAVGMFGMASVGKTIAIAHYIAALLVGITFRFYGMRDRSEKVERVRHGNIVGRAVDALANARQEDGRPFGQMMGDAVKESIQTLWMICGFIMLFATMVKIIDVVGLYPLLAMPFEWLFKLAGINLSLVRAVVAGLFEIDLGTVAAAKAQGSLVQAVAIAGAIIAWSGLSVHGQVASVLTGTDIRMRPYVLARLLHAVLAYIVTLMIMPTGGTIGWEWGRIVPVFGGMQSAYIPPPFADVLMRGLTWAIGLPLGLAVVGVAAAGLSGGFRLAGFHTRR